MSGVNCMLGTKVDKRKLLKEARDIGLKIFWIF